MLQAIDLDIRPGEVVGIEGDAGLVDRARRNAERNRISNAAFFSADLYGELQSEPWMDDRFDKALLDPPRSGALQVLPLLPGLGVQRIVYVSCEPTTLARDGALLIEGGYHLLEVQPLDMFPQTFHVETVSLWQRADG